MDWWISLGNLVVLVLFASMAEEHLDHPDWIADPPLLRWTANAVVGAATAVLLTIGLMAAAFVWRVIGAIFGVVLAVFIVGGGALWLWEFITPEDPSAE